jgi:glycoside hydrolase-like protein
MIVDFAFGRPPVAELKAAGVTGVVRYLCKDPNKRLDKDEVAAYRANGITIHAVYQDGTRDGFDGLSGGIGNAQRALAQARDVGWDLSGCLYYVPADENIERGDLPVLREYARGWASVLSPQCCGVYGETLLLDDLYAIGLVAYRWQAAAMSFSNFVPASCNLRQQPRQITVAGVQMDLNTQLMPKTGAWFGGANTMSATGPEHWDAADWKAFDAHVWGARPEAADGGKTPIRQGNMMQVLNKAYVFGGGSVTSFTDLAAQMSALAAQVAALEPTVATTLEGTLDVTLTPKK